MKSQEFLSWHHQKLSSSFPTRKERLAPDHPCVGSEKSNLVISLQLTSAESRLGRPVKGPLRLPGCGLAAHTCVSNLPATPPCGPRAGVPPLRSEFTMDYQSPNMSSLQPAFPVKTRISPMYQAFARSFLILCTSELLSNCQRKNFASKRTLFEKGSLPRAHLLCSGTQVFLITFFFNLIDFFFFFF